MWKKIAVKEGDAAREFLKRSGYSTFAPGKIRITLEEEVNECCDKWREDNKRILCDSIRYRTFGSHMVFKFCPECGKTL